MWVHSKFNTKLIAYFCRVAIERSNQMKKLSAIFFLALFLVASLSSCKSHEKCPAYSKAPSIEKTQDQA